MSRLGDRVREFNRMPGVQADHHVPILINDLWAEIVKLRAALALVVETDDNVMSSMPTGVIEDARSLLRDFGYPAPCQVTGCHNDAFYEGWYRVMDPITARPTGLIRKLHVCEDHVSMLIGSPDWGTYSCNSSKQP